MLIMNGLSITPARLPAAVLTDEKAQSPSVAISAWYFLPSFALYPGGSPTLTENRTPMDGDWKVKASTSPSGTGRDSSCCAAMGAAEMATRNAGAAATAAVVMRIEDPGRGQGKLTPRHLHDPPALPRRAGVDSREHAQL